MSWPLVSLEDCCEIVGGATPKRNNPEYWHNDIPWVTPKDISGLEGNVLSDAPEYISQIGFDSCSTYLLPKSAILLTSRAPIGNVAIVGKPMCTNQGFKSLVPKGNVDYLYLFYCIKNFSLKLQSLGNGATFKEISKKKVESFQIPLPPLEEQKRIAAILDKADAIRRKRQQAIELADQLSQSLFLDMFGDPVTNTKNWGLKKFGDITSSRLGKMLDAKKQNGNNKKKYLRNPNVQWRNIVLDDLKEMDFDLKDQVEFSLKAGDLLICEGGEVGRSAIWKDDLEDCYFQKALHRVRPNVDIITSEYLCELMWFLAHYGGLDDYVTSSTIAHLTGAKLKSIQIAVPPLNMQKAFIKKSSHIQKQKKQAEENLAKSEDLFNSLVQRAFKGELTQTQVA